MTWPFPRGGALHIESASGLARIGALVAASTLHVSRIRFRNLG
jgi:hypothetical protein